MDRSVVDQALQERRFEDAIRFLEATPREEMDVDLWLQLSECFESTQQWLRQIAALEEALRIANAHPRVLDELFVTYVYIGQYREAQRIHRLSCEANRPDWELQLQRAFLAALSGRMRRAERLWSEAARLAPSEDDRRRVNSRIAYLLLKKGRLSHDYVATVEATEGREPALLVEAEVLRSTGNRAALVQSVGLAVAAGYTGPWWDTFKAQREWLLGNRGEAIRILERKCSVHPGDIGALRQLIVYLMIAKQRKRALGYAHRAAECAPMMPQLGGTAIFVYLANRRFSDAWRVFRDPWSKRSRNSPDGLRV